MNIQPKSLKQQAARLVSTRTPHYRRTVTLHAAVSLGLLFVLNLIHLLLSSAIGDTGGLSDIGTRTMLETAQSTLMTAANIALPFWEAGILYTSIRVARQQETEFSMLTQGFRRFGPLLRYMILWMMICFGVALLCINVLSVFSVFMPVPPALEQAFATIDPTAITDPTQFYQQLPVEELMPFVIGITVVYSLVCLVIIAVLSYRFRFSQYLLTDETPIRARAALALSNHLTKGHKKSLFMLDLSFWWYYLLQFAVAAIVYIPDILTRAGITLPISGDAANVLFYGLYCVASLILVWFAGAYVQTVNACAYTTVRDGALENSQ